MCVVGGRGTGPSPAASLLGRLLFALGVASQGEANIHRSNLASGTSEDEVGKTETRESGRAGAQDRRLGLPSSSGTLSNPGFLWDYGLQSLVLHLFLGWTLWEPEDSLDPLLPEMFPHLCSSLSEAIYISPLEHSLSLSFALCVSLSLSDLLLSLLQSFRGFEDSP